MSDTNEEITPKNVAVSNISKSLYSLGEIITTGDGDVNEMILSAELLLRKARKKLMEG